MRKTPFLAMAATLGLLALASIAISSDDDGRGWWRGRGAEDRGSAGLRGADVPPVSFARYASECGSCHFAYQPGLLPARSWERIMATLDDHFGENAELESAATAEIRRYLTEHASDRTAFGRAPGFARSVAGEVAPLRITDIPYFREKHHEVPPGLVSGNPQVRSFSQCQACHRRAEQGVYDEHDIVIAGYGPWDD